MKRANPLNLNTRLYWNGVYGTPDKRQGYADAGTADALPGSIQETKRFSTTLTLVKDGDRFLDMGCGVGVMTKLVKDTYPNCEVWGTDISDQAIEDNKKIHPGITYHHGYIGAQDFLPENYFDVVFCGETIEHMDDPADVMKDAHRVLKPGGILVITTPLLDAIRSEEHTFFFEWDDIKNLYRNNGFALPTRVYLPNMEHLLVIYAYGTKL